MSARQPFVPQQKPPFRAQPDVEQPSGHSDSTNATHLNGPVPNSGFSHTSSGSHDTLTSFVSPLNGINKPLNINGLARAKFSNARRSFEDSSSRAHSPRPSLAQHAARIPTSVGLLSTASGLSPMSAFRPSLVQPASKSHSAAVSDDFSANQAHIPSSMTDLDDVEDAKRNNYISPPPPGFRRHVHSRTSLEDIREEAEDELEALDPGSSSEAQRHQHDANFQEDSSSIIYNAAFSPSESMRNKPPLRRVTKRIERQEDMDPEDRPRAAKRARVDKPEDSRVRGEQDEKSDFGTPPPPPPFSLPSMRTPSPPPYGYQRPGDVPEREDHAVRRLLGRDLDAYVSAHISTYEEAKKKWSECSQDEWVAGAQEIADRFTELIDFVKDHMTTKLKLYASLHSTLSTHRTVLSGREDTLKTARESLVRDSDKVVSGRLGKEQGGERVKLTAEV
ncbi:hypothetical protein PsYK624_138080 [Phanerochaete sordida]|uniref:Extracellular mutant protein 11 C-terminal domain-containing protein n=1 Tax=Phanerochaete sordida TaxID=48140 RepID=A0A9P3LKT7_9APHY|nr:hypothetical protein PsYK624_138080 [Phanerochaete sordida]